MFNELIVRLVNIGGIVYHHCLNVRFIIVLFIDYTVKKVLILIILLFY